MDIKNVFTILAGVSFFVAFIPYIVTIIKGDTKPKKATWLIWSILDTITFVGMVINRSVKSQIIGAILGVLIVTFLAFKKGESGWEIVDKICLASAVIGIGFIVFGNPTQAMIASLSGVFIVFFPTFKSAWQKPKDEDNLSWLLWWLGGVSALLAVPNWTIEHFSQPITFFTIDSIVMFLLFIKTKFHK